MVSLQVTCLYSITPRQISEQLCSCVVVNGTNSFVPFTYIHQNALQLRVNRTRNQQSWSRYSTWQIDD